MSIPIFAPVRRRLLAPLLWLASTMLQAAPVSVPPALMPLPAEAAPSEGRLDLRQGISVVFTGPTSPRLDRAVARALAALRRGTGPGFDTTPAPGRPVLRIECGDGTVDAYPILGDDEAYTLSVNPDGATLTAARWLGVLRGLETLPQLLDEQGRLWCGTLRDRPRFPWRGLMIDVSRHWIPKEVILRNLDGMAHVKLNTLHLHLSDDQGFRLEIRTVPALHRLGSDGDYFTQQDIREIVAYAADRGIRVVPEFDVPGHATSWLVSHPELGSAPGPYHLQRKWGVFNPVLDPTQEGTYALLGTVFGEVAGLFPDPYVHIGGDENNGVDWNANPRLQRFIEERGLHDNEGLHTHFNRRLHDLLAPLGKRMLGWDEILQPGLPKAAVIQSWRGTEALAAAARQGYSGLLSNGYYIDLCEPASRHYLVDPLPEGVNLTEAEQARILGGEATQWSEWVDRDTIDSRIWPRTAAIAERLWSPRHVRDVDDMYRRLEYTSERLAGIGLQHRAHRPRALQRLLDHPETPERIADLGAFVALVEPVKGYRRGGHQPWHNQLLPLDGVADAAIPDSAEARALSAVLRACAQGSAHDRATAGRLRSSLETWRLVGRRVGWEIAPHHGRLVDAAEIAKGLAQACEVALEALACLEAGSRPSADTLARWAGILERCSQANSSAIELPFLPDLKALTEATTRD